MYRGSLTKEQQNQVLDLNLEGWGYQKISEQSGISYGKVRRWLEHYANNQEIEDREEDWEYPNLSVVCFDLETTDLNTFFGRLLVASFLDINTGVMETHTLYDFEVDKKLSIDEMELMLLWWATDQYEEAFILVGQNITAFDRHFLQGRHEVLETGYVMRPALHFDTRQIAQHQAKIRPQGFSLENLLDYYRLPVQKDKPSKHEWARSRELNREAIARLVVRCELDVKGTALLAGKLLGHVKRGPGIKSIR